MAVEIGAILEGKITGITNFGAFVELPDKTTGMVHISEVSSSFIKDIREKLTEGDQVKVKVIDINEKGKVALSIKKAQPEQTEESKPKKKSKKSKTQKEKHNGAILVMFLLLKTIQKKPYLSKHLQHLYLLPRNAKM